MAITHQVRDGKGAEVYVRTTPTKAIRLFCVECLGHQAGEVAKCTAALCPLYPYRMGCAHTGRRPKSASTGPDPAQNRAITAG
jgi:hypothetical protein